MAKVTKTITVEDVQWRMVDIKGQGHEYAFCIYPYIKGEHSVMTRLGLPDKGKTKLTIEFED